MRYRCRRSPVPKAIVVLRLQWSLCEASFKWSILRRHMRSSAVYGHMCEPCLVCLARMRALLGPIHVPSRKCCTENSCTRGHAEESRDNAFCDRRKMSHPMLSAVPFGYWLSLTRREPYLPQGELISKWTHSLCPIGLAHRHLPALTSLSRVPMYDTLGLPSVSVMLGISRRAPSYGRPSGC